MHLKPWEQHATRVIIDTAFRNPARLGKERRFRSLDPFALGVGGWSVATEISQDAADARVYDSFLDSTPKENWQTFTVILLPFRWSQPMHSKHGKLNIFLEVLKFKAYEHN